MSSQLKTPLSEWHRSHNGRLVDFAGWSMPVQYASIITEHEAVRTGVGLFDVSHMGRLEFNGEMGMDLLQRATVNDVSLLNNNQIQYSLMVDDLGGTIDDILIYRMHSDRWAMVCNASNRAAVTKRLTELNHDNARIDDVTCQTGMIAIQGPKALEVVEKKIDPSAGKIKYYHFKDFLFEGKPTRLSRTGYTGEDGFEWIVPAELAESVWSKLVDSGAVPCGLGARDTLRLEAGMPLYGHELSLEIDPFSAGLSSFVKLEKGPFAGHQALTRISSAPPQRRIGLILEGRRPARQDCPVICNGEPVGVVTSGTFSPTLNKPVAMALVKRTSNWPPSDAVFEVDIRGTLVAATLSKLPFYRRNRTSAS